MGHQEFVNKEFVNKLAFHINPVLPFLWFFLWISLANSKQGDSLVNLALSLSFPRISWVQQGQKILGNFEGFLGRKQTKIKERKDRERAL